MIDPVTAFAVAQVAIKGIQSAIKMGKDINGIMSDVIKFMDAKDAVVASKSKTSAKSDTGNALETVMQAKKLADQEKELKEMLIYSGNGDVWTDMLQERSKIRQQRQRDEIKAEKKKRQLAKELDEIFTVVLWAPLLVTVVIGASWLTLQVIS